MTNSALQDKLAHLKYLLGEMGGVVVAYSGGVDSSLLLKVAHDRLGDRCVAVTSYGADVPESELDDCKNFCKSEGIRHILVVNTALDNEDFRKNPSDRCYHCKTALFSSLRKIADDFDIKYIVEGSNKDDDGDYRPGRKATREAGARSPLKDAHLTKAEIRELSKLLGLPTWNKPAMACLSSRIPYGERITPDKLRQIEKAEQYLRTLGLTQLRVRHHGAVARIELPPDSFGTVLSNAQDVYDAFREIGFQFTALDILGYRMGAMNEGIAE